MVDETDGVDESVQVAFQAALITASRLGEQLARMQERSAREAQQRSEHAAREHGQRLEAERAAARASVSAVHEAQWWKEATAEDVARAYQTTSTWAERDPDIARAQDRIVQEVQTRYGVTLDKRAGSRESVADALFTVDAARNQRTAGAQEELTAAQLLREAHAADARAADDGAETAGRSGGEGDYLESQAEVAYDSADRREHMARDLESIGNDTAVQARVRADVSQARPATEATRPASKNAPKARRQRGAGARQQEEVSRSR